VAEIQRHIIKRGKRNAISRRYHAKDDKEATTTWRLEFNNILHVFNVRFITSPRRLLSSRFQTELGTNEHATVSGTHQDAANKHTIVSNVHPNSSNAEVIAPDVRSDVSNAHPIVSHSQSDVAGVHTIVSNVHHNKLKSREGKHQAVSTARTLLVTE